VVGDPMASAYTAVYLWKKAVEKANSFDVPAVIAASSELTLDAPEGEVKVHKDNPLQILSRDIAPAVCPTPAWQVGRHLAYDWIGHRRPARFGTKSLTSRLII